MKKSSAISLSAVLAVAAALTSSCNNNDNVKRCVDKNTNVVVADSCCNPKSSAHRSGGGVHPFLWYYGGRGFATGDHISNGSFTPTAGKSYTPAQNGISRGGFGTTGSGRSVVS